MTVAVDSRGSASDGSVLGWYFLSLSAGMRYKINWKEKSDGSNKVWQSGVGYVTALLWRRAGVTELLQQFGLQDLSTVLEDPISGNKQQQQQQQVISTTTRQAKIEYLLSGFWQVRGTPESLQFQKVPRGDKRHYGRSQDVS